MAEGLLNLRFSHTTVLPTREMPHVFKFLTLPKSDLVLLNDVCKLSSPDEAVVWCNEQETVAAVQGWRSGLH